MKIIVDAMGGDNAPKAPVMGAIAAAKTYDVEIILVGQRKNPGMPERGGHRHPAPGWRWHLPLRW